MEKEGNHTEQQQGIDLPLLFTVHGIQSASEETVFLFFVVHLIDHIYEKLSVSITLLT